MKQIYFTFLALTFLALLSCGQKYANHTLTKHQWSLSDCKYSTNKLGLFYATGDPDTSDEKLTSFIEEHSKDLLEQNKKFIMQFNKDGNAVVTVQNNTINGTWHVDPQNTSLWVDVEQNTNEVKSKVSNNITYKIISMTETQLVLEQSPLDRIQIIYTFEPAK